ncbi:hypothetical protein L6452_22059 [Arctium lappa]|uniref:Uncharacterized protein n=1 Tax=Arctium lappa TaxID=4217 RepID=A0ACB9AZ16_ARCLA|nr:hypothetical protein L6452_22059 [Arctium lappa]
MVLFRLAFCDFKTRLCESILDSSYRFPDIHPIHIPGVSGQSFPDLVLVFSGQTILLTVLYFQVDTDVALHDVQVRSDSSGTATESDDETTIEEVRGDGEDNSIEEAIVDPDTSANVGILLEHS